jgi:hypothetical protein
MQAVTGRNVDLDRQPVLQEELYLDEVDQREFFRRVLVQKQVEIARRFSAVASDRAEQVQ